MVSPGSAVKVAPVGSPAAVSEVMLSWSGSDALTLTVRARPSTTPAVAGAVTTGARSTLVMVRVVGAEAERALDAVNETGYEPAWL